MSLADYTASQNRENFNLKTVAVLVMTLAKSLDRLHRKKIIHRDICMENIAVKVSKSSSNPSHDKLKL